MKRNWLWWTARIYSAVSILIWLGVTAAYTFLGDGTYELDFLLMILVVMFTFISVVVAWWRAGLGAIMLFISALLNSIFGVVSPGLNRVFAIAVSGSPFLLASLLFLGVWLQTRREPPQETEK